MKQGFNQRAVRGYGVSSRARINHSNLVRKAKGIKDKVQNVSLIAGQGSMLAQNNRTLMISCNRLPISQTMHVRAPLRDLL